MENSEVPYEVSTFLPSCRPDTNALHLLKSLFSPATVRVRYGVGVPAVWNVLAAFECIHLVRAVILQDEKRSQVSRDYSATLLCVYAVDSRFPDVWKLTGKYMAMASGDRKQLMIHKVPPFSLPLYLQPSLKKKKKKKATLDRSWAFHPFFLLRSWHGSGHNRRHGGLIPASEQATDTLTDSQGRKEPASALS
ncbi:uncharacterized [Tachysurus ichikawai]